MHSLNDTFTIARNLLRKKEYSEAEAILSEALNAEPANLPLMGLLAEVFFKTGRFKEAEQMNSSILAINPSDYFALQRKGDLLAREKKFDEAIEIFENLLSTGGGNPFLYRRIARAYQLQKNFEKAIDIIQKAIAKYPDKSDLHYQAFVLYRDTGMYDEAMQAISEAVQLEPYNELYRSAKLSLRAENESAENLQEAAELTGDSDPGMLKILARKLKKEGKIEKAIEIFKKVVALEDSDFARKELAFAYYHHKDFAKAFALFMSLGDDAFREAPFVASIVASAKTPEEKQALVERMARLAAAGNTSLWGKIKKLRRELPETHSDEESS